MKQRFIIVSLLTLTCAFTLQSCGQSIKKVVTGTDTTFYIKGKHYRGVIFPASYVRDIREKGRFTPGKDKVNEAEAALSQIWNRVNIAQKNLNQHTIPNVTPYFGNYMRQYFGYTDEHGQRAVYVHLLNFYDKPQAAKYFMGWGTKYIDGTDPFYQENTAGFSYNLVTKVIVEN